MQPAQQLCIQEAIRLGPGWGHPQSLCVQTVPCALSEDVVPAIGS